jgi:hypothetical protein
MTSPGSEAALGVTVLTDPKDKYVQIPIQAA